MRLVNSRWCDLFWAAPLIRRSSVRRVFAHVILQCACWLLLLPALPAHAWNSTGHRLGALLAWDVLHPSVRAEVSVMLDAHPAATAWDRALRGQKGAARLAEAAVWPDTLRESHPTYDTTAQGRDWHFINWPIGLPLSAAPGGELLAQLERLPARVADRTLPMQERSIALAWLVHLVGDAHTPLHAANWRDAAGRWTAGGNGVPIIDADQAGDGHDAHGNLHRFWDDLPGPRGLRGRRLDTLANTLRQRFPANTIDQGGPIQWLEESHRAVIEVVRPEGRDPTTITSAYRQAAGALAARRVALSGVRLGRWLNVLLENATGPAQSRPEGFNPETR